MKNDTGLRMDRAEIVKCHLETKKLIMKSDTEISPEDIDNLSAEQMAIGLFDYTATGKTLAETYDIVNEILGTSASWLL